MPARTGRSGPDGRGTGRLLIDFYLKESTGRCHAPLHDLRFTGLWGVAPPRGTSPRGVAPPRRGSVFTAIYRLSGAWHPLRGRSSFTLACCGSALFPAIYSTFRFFTRPARPWQRAAPRCPRSFLPVIYRLSGAWHLLRGRSSSRLARCGSARFPALYSTLSFFAALGRPS